MSYKDYEKLVAKIVQGLAKLQGLANSKVSHDVQVEGRFGTHQIDVLWEFQIGLVKFKTIFQAKDWTKPVTFEALKTFSGVLQDIPDAKGVMVTRIGYEEGNIQKIAKGNGIELLVLDEFGNIHPGQHRPSFGVKITLQDGVGISNFKFRTEEQAIAFRKFSDTVDRSEVVFCSKDGDQLKTPQIQQMLLQMSQQQGVLQKGRPLIYKPDSPLFVKTSPTNQVEILEIHFLVQPDKVLAEKKWFISHILHSATGDETYYVDDSFNVHKQDKMSFDVNYIDPNDSTKTRTTVFSVENRTSKKKLEHDKSDEP